MRFALRLGAVAAGVGAVVVVLLVYSSVPRQRLLDGYVLFIGSLLLLGLVRATSLAGRSGEASLYEIALGRRERPPERPGELEKLEREVTLAAASSFDVHFRLRPVLREIAAHRLAAQRGADLDRGSPDVREALGEELWDLVRPDREPPEDRFGPGFPLTRLRRALERLERI
jgi:hypothetical protein